jgi:hypothetical protein
MYFFENLESILAKKYLNTTPYTINKSSELQIF